MSLSEDNVQLDNRFYVLITGANSGLGLGVGRRLIDEFLETRPESESLILIVTTRDKRKGDATVEQLHDHLLKTCRNLEKTRPGSSALLQRRVHFRQEILDLLSLLSVQTLSKRLRETTPKIDVVICNAGIGGWTGLNWGYAVWTILTNWKNAVTWPEFKIAGVGWVTKAQIPSLENGETVEEPPLGEVFCANFFGHYLLGHYLAPLLARHAESEQTKGRLIWVSSVEGYTHSLDMNDIQGIEAEEAYMSTKRLTDIMGITSTLPSTAKITDRYLDRSGPSEKTTKPRIYVAHPGICGTSIFPLNFILEYCMLFAFYMARWLGSQWHPITVEKGACALVWLALAKQSTLDTMEEREGAGKWGSATDWFGNERVERTEVEGWGWGGKLGDKRKWKNRSPYAKDLTQEDRETFEETGKTCWAEMEKLRLEWEKRLDDAGVGVKME
ncbi:3-keto-steroid reductase [Melanomma pulvis-pyrius CBS 109.77]|uniref:3-keto-steroid reductase n=1 Tax=Melanomma pulvis-pyrius CBS 109.77 TaxID=1314802 RepID=A0A6A6XUQ7_9PLEO|nr:3-keto-steroid reductase [Melanomma pulvis-pyrius CBS 109.77]